MSKSKEAAHGKRCKSGLIIVAIAIPLVIGGLLGLHFFRSDYTQSIRTNWEISLPSGCSLTYKAQSASGFHGDGQRYHVYSVTDSEALELLFSWEDEESATIYAASYTEAISNWLTNLSVKDGQYPNFSDCAYYYASQADNSELILVWDRGNNTLYVAEQFL